MAFINAAAQAVERSISDVLRHIGENPRREGLKDTPRRYIKALREFTSGYDDAPAEILSTVFKDESFDEMIILRGIEFQSLCEHHLMPFVGTATVGYIPDPEIGIVGLSKLARVASPRSLWTTAASFGAAAP
ncbi:MAG: GTP cyclohydrolase I, partial [Gemmatimonadales bacterium]